MAADPPARLTTAPDLRALEADLLAAVDAEDEAVRRDPARLARPAWLVVPSASLAAHLRRRLVSAGAVRLGWRVATLAQVARELAPDPRPGDVALELAVERRGREHPALAAGPARTADGLEAVAASVRDLLDAGIDATDREAWLEALEPELAGPAERERVHALFDVALAVRADLDRAGRAERGALLRAAATRLEAEPDALPARVVLVHGFADVTDAAARLVAALAALPVTRLWLELPADPFGGDDEARPELRFVERMRRLARGVLVRETATERATPATRLESLAAGDRADECERVARVLRAGLDADPELAPEDVAVVLRDADAYRPFLPAALARHGVPASGVGLVAAADGPGRRLEALVRLLAEGPRATLDALETTLVAGRRPDALLAFQLAGVTRLADLAEVDWSAHLARDRRDRVALPQRTPRDDGQGLRPVEVPLDELEVVREEWRALGQAAERIAALGTWGAVREALGRFARERLGWSPGTDEAARLARVVAVLDEGLEHDEPLDDRELLALLERRVADVARPPLAGAGGGVQLLSTTEARARTFRWLVVVGMNRGTFPRVVPEDPLLADRLRAPLVELVPEFPLKGRSYDEERHLFASLLGAAERATLAWCTDDGEGRPQLVAPLVERLARSREVLALPEPGPSAADELVARGRDGDRDGWRAALEAELPPAEAEHLARVVDELERPTHEPRPGPWLGFVGLRPAPRELYVTHLEAWQTCPWRHLLTRVLRLEPRPDPLGALPDLDPATLGSAVHETLERCLGVPTKVDLDDREALARVAAAEPDARPAERVLGDVAETLAARNGVRWRGYPAALARRALPYVRKGQELLATPVAAESEGTVVVPAGRWGTLRLRFRADLVERRDDAWLATDFKTGRTHHRGRPLVKTAATAAKHVLAAVCDGSHLQAFAYARSLGKDAVGRYLYLHPDLDAKVVRELAAPADDAELAAAFERTVEATLDGLAHGVHTARLALRAKQGTEANGACERCEVRVACSIGDSGQKARFEALLLAADGTPEVWRAGLEPERLGDAGDDA